MFAGTMIERDEHTVTVVSQLRSWQQGLKCHLNAVFSVTRLEQMYFFRTDYKQMVSGFCVSHSINISILLLNQEAF